MAGYGWRLSVSQATIQKRNPPCVPFWIPSGPCVGDAHSATQDLTQSNCPDLAGNSQTDCRNQMPYTCSINDVQLDPSVLTCGDCTSVNEGDTCNLVCADPNATFEFLSIRSLICLQSGFSPIPEARVPKCTVPEPSCPPILSWNGMATDQRSRCVGAQEGDVCRVSCMPGYYSKNGWFDATCTNLKWSRPLVCDCQACGEFNDPVCAASPYQNNFNHSFL